MVKYIHHHFNCRALFENDKTKVTSRNKRYSTTTTLSRSATLKIVYFAELNRSFCTVEITLCCFAWKRACSFGLVAWAVEVHEKLTKQGKDSWTSSEMHSQAPVCGIQATLWIFCELVSISEKFRGHILPSLLSFPCSAPRPKI